MKKHKYLLGLAVFLASLLIFRYFIIYSFEASALAAIMITIWYLRYLWQPQKYYRYNYLHPVPKRYHTINYKAFNVIKEVLAQRSFDMNDKWHFDELDILKGNLKAFLLYSYTDPGPNAPNIVRIKGEPFTRLLELKVKVKDKLIPYSGFYFADVKIDLYPNVEPKDYAACAAIISDLLKNIEIALHEAEKLRPKETPLGGGVHEARSDDTMLQAPPKWLLNSTFIAIIIFGISMPQYLIDKYFNNLSNVRSQMQSVENLDSLVTDQYFNKIYNEFDFKKFQELCSWERFKETYHL